MLEAIRRHSKGLIGKIVMTTAMSLLILSFAIWGIGDVLRRRVDNSVARVGHVAISVDEYQRALQRQIDSLRESLGPEFDMSQARALGIDKRVLESLIRTTALDLGAETLDLTVPDDTLAQQIREIPAFRGPLGNFDRQQFFAALQRAGYTEETFVAGMRRDGIRSQLVNSVAGGIAPPSLMAAPLFSYLGEQRIARYFILPPDAAGKAIAPSAEELRAYYEENKESYRAPEYRGFTYIAITPEALVSRIEVSEDDLRRQYEAHREDYGEPEKRTLLQLVFDTEEDARTARAEIDGGKSLADIAAARDRTSEDIRLENKTRADVAAPLGEAAAEAAFSLSQGEVSAPLEGRFGWLLLTVESVAPGHTLSFEEARDQIREELALEEATELVIDVSNKVEDERAAGAPLESAAKAAGLAATAVKAVDAEGHDPDGKAVAGLAPEILREAFSQDLNIDADMKPLGEGGYFIVRVNEITPADIRPLESVKDKVTEDYLDVQRAQRLESLAKHLADRVKAGAPFDSLATELGRAPLNSDPIQRGSSNETFSREAIEKLFAAEAGEVVWGPVGLGESMLLMQLQSMRAPDPASDQASYNSVLEELAGALANDLELAFTDALQEQFEVDIDDRALENLRNES